MRTLETTSDESRARAVQAELKKLLRGRDSPTKREEPPVKFEPYLIRTTPTLRRSRVQSDANSEPTQQQTSEDQA